MKKLLVPIIAIFGFLSSAQAQMDFGIKTSVGTSIAQNETTYAGNVFDFINHEVTYTGSNLVKSYGVFVQDKAGPIFARAEASFTHFNQKYNVRTFIELNQGPRDVSEKFSFFDFQLLGGVHHRNVYLGVGPVAHFLLYKSQPLEFISGYNEDLRKLTYGFTTSVGFDAGAFNIAVRFINNFRTVGDHINYGTRDARFTQKPHEVNITLGINI